MKWWANGTVVCDTTADCNGTHPPSVQVHCFSALIKTGRNLLAVKAVSGVGSFVLAAAPPRTLLAKIDTAWIYRGSGDPAAWIRKLSGRQQILHLKDTLQPDYPTLELGAGELDWPDILAAADGAGIETIIYSTYQPIKPSKHQPFPLTQNESERGGRSHYSNHSFNNCAYLMETGYKAAETIHAPISLYQDRRYK